MKHSDFVKAVADEAFATQTDASRVIRAFVKVVEDAVHNGEEVTIKGLGKFSSKKRNARVGINPSTGEKLTIPAQNVVAFKVAKEFKDIINS